MFPAWLPWLRNLFLIIFLLILIGLDQTVILVYYTTLYMHSLIRGTPKTLKNRQNRLKLAVLWLPWLRILFFYFFFFSTGCPLGPATRVRILAPIGANAFDSIAGQTNKHDRFLNYSILAKT